MAHQHNIKFTTKIYIHLVVGLPLLYIGPSTCETKPRALLTHVSFLLQVLAQII